MATTTSIEWTEKTWNPVTGCSKVSPGCAHCYAEGVALRFWSTQYPPVEYETYSVDNCCPITEMRPREFTDVMCHEDRLHQPLKWRTPARIFVNSMSDLFHEDVPDEFIDRVFAVMALTPQHTHQILTKRMARMREYMTNWPDGAGRVHHVRSAAHKRLNEAAGKSRWFSSDAEFQKALECCSKWPLPNVWLGVSVESQKYADERIPLLIQTPAAVRFISAEPLLGPVDLREYMDGREEHGTPFSDPPARTVGGCIRWTPPLDWVIVGGESGQKARPCDVAWIRSIVLQCAAAGVPAFVKQLGTNALNSSMSQTCCNGKVHYRQPVGSERDVEHRELIAKGVAPAYTVEPMQLDLHHSKGGDPAEWPEDLRVREFPTVRTRNHPHQEGGNDHERRPGRAERRRRAGSADPV